MIKIEFRASGSGEKLHRFQRHVQLRTGAVHRGQERRNSAAIPRGGDGVRGENVAGERLV